MTSVQHGNETLPASELICQLTEDLVSNPDVLAAYGRKLDSMIQRDGGFIQYLPRCVKRRLKALKKLQVEVFKVEESFYKQVHKLEALYTIKQKPILQRREQIVSGASEPTENECSYASDNEENTKSSKSVSQNMKKALINRTFGVVLTDDSKGIPEFWLTIFRNVSILNDMIRKHDYPVLAKLRDVRIEYFNDKTDIGFEVIFDFGENEYFEEKELRKKFNLRIGLDAEDSMSYEGPEIISCSSFHIHWKKDKNITVKSRKVKRGNKRFVNKLVKTESFFNYFSASRSSSQDDTDENERICDFEVGQVLKDNIVPRAFLYYTGLAFKNEDLEDYSDYSEPKGQPSEADSLNDFSDD